MDIHYTVYVHAVYCHISNLSMLGHSEVTSVPDMARGPSIK